jgi:death-on-curing protein
LTEPVFLGLDDVIAIHNDQIKRYGGRTGIRDIDLLKSAAAVPAAGYNNGYFHLDVYEMAAAYLFHIVRDHPFVDENKRTGAVASIVFLTMNGVDINADEDAFERLIIATAEGKIDKASIAQFFRDNSENPE